MVTRDVTWQHWTTLEFQPPKQWFLVSAMFTVVLCLPVAHLSSDEIETILRENYVELHGAMCVNPAAMARKLYVQGFITEDTLHAVASNQTATTVEAEADILMKELYSFILTHESPAKVFAVFLGILKSAGGASHNVAVSILEVL